MDAGTLSCPTCGANADRDAVVCRYCSAHLQTAACPSCFALGFVGTKHCVRCGATLDRPIPTLPTSGERPSCPRCKQALNAIALGSTLLDQCERCGGLWVDHASFQEICAQTALSAAIHDLGIAAPASVNRALVADAQVAYVPCPACAKFMNRMNFARISGVIIDACKPHGTWFDRDELSRIIDFIRKGGLEVAREREKVAMEEERRRLEAERRAKDLAEKINPEVGRMRGLADFDSFDLLSAIGSAIRTLKS